MFDDVWWFCLELLDPDFKICLHWSNRDPPAPLQLASLVEPEEVIGLDSITSENAWKCSAFAIPCILYGANLFAICIWDCTISPQTLPSNKTPIPPYAERDTGGGGDTYSKLSSGTHLDRSQIAHFTSNPCEQQLTQSAWSSDPTHPSNGQSTSGTRPPTGEATSNCNLPLCAYRNCLCLHLPNSELNLEASSSHDLIFRIKRSGSWSH